jgi:hypothetical protein
VRRGARARVHRATAGYPERMFEWWKKKREEHRANKQQGGPEALGREGDPRGGLQDEAYRTADPRDPVEADGVAMSGPGGAPQEGLTAEERRELDR